MADASSTATSSPATNGTSGPAVPATPASSPGAAGEGQKPPAPPVTTRTQRSYSTATRRFSAPAAPSAPEVRSAAPPAPPAGAAAASGADSAVGGTAPAAGEPAAAPEAGASAREGEAAASATEPAKEGLTEEEGAKRLAQISRAERRLSEEKRAHGEALAVAQAVAQVLPGASPAQVQQALGQLRQLHDARAAATKDPVGFLHRVFGVAPERVRQLAIDGVLADAGKTPAQREAERVASLEERQAAYERQLREEQQTRQQSETARAAGEYQRTVLTPLLSDPSNPKAFENIRTFCAVNGQDPARELYNAMVVRFQATGRTPDPKALAQELETLLQPRLASLRGANAAPAQQADRKREEPPQATQGSRRVTPTADKPPGAASTPEFRRPREHGRPYLATPKK